MFGSSSARHKLLVDQVALMEALVFKTRKLEATDNNLAIGAEEVTTTVDRSEALSVLSLKMASLGVTPHMVTKDTHHMRHPRAPIYIRYSGMTEPSAITNIEAYCKTALAAYYATWLDSGKFLEAV